MRIIKSLCLILSLWAVARFCHYQTDGFRLSKITQNTTPLKRQFPPLLTAEEKSSLDERLSQPYRYLGRGKQSFAFVSEDGKTVLKFFNNRVQRKLKWWSSRKSKRKLEKAFKSYQIAFEKLKNEAGLLYFHPQSGPDQFAALTLIDKLGIAHKINLNVHGFLLQKRATLVYPYLEQCSSEEERKEALQSIIHLLRTKMERGIADNDPLIRANIGFDDHRAIQIDVGPFEYDPALQEREKQSEELKKMTLGLKHWLEAHYPELVGTLNEAIH